MVLIEVSFHVIDVTWVVDTDNPNKYQKIEYIVLVEDLKWNLNLVNGVTVSCLRAKVSPGNLMIWKRCSKRVLASIENDPYMPVLRKLYAWNHLDKSLRNGH